jgi:hypothetical protein
MQSTKAGSIKTEKRKKKERKKERKKEGRKPFSI